VSYKTTWQADQDIIDIYVRGAADFGVDQAERYHKGLTAVFDRLAKNPDMACKRMEFTPPVRLHPYHAHMIVYVEHGSGILIVRILHSRQDWERHLS
jgi:toxin ParE1/3/4